MNKIPFVYEYPATLVPDRESGGYVVTFADFPEAITQGDTLEEAIEQAEDCLEEAVANRIMMNVALPAPSRRAPSATSGPCRKNAQTFQTGFSFARLIHRLREQRLHLSR